MDIKELFEILSDSEKEFIYLISKDWRAKELVKTKEIDDVNRRFLLSMSNGKMSSRLISALLLNFQREVIEKDHLLRVNARHYRSIGGVLLHELQGYLYID